MAVRKLIVTTAIVFVCVAAAPRPASADWLFTPFVGTAFNSSANFNDGFDDPDEFERRFTYGASLGWMGAGILGVEFDFGYSPNFFETVVVDDDKFDVTDDSNVTTLMGNIIIGAPIGGQTGPGIRPFGVAGVGLIRSKLTEPLDFFDDIESSDFGFNIGGGITGFFSDSIGIRGDIRYFRSFEGNDEDSLDLDLGEFDFWRATVGVTFRWGAQ